MNDESTLEHLGRSFVAQLLEDVLAADAHSRTDDTQSNRRALVKTIFSAIEGSVWLCRENVLDASRALGELTPLIEMALRERTYTITSRGDVVEQIRYVTLPAMIRLTVRQAQRIAPDLQIDFSGSGWSLLRASTEIRNRITHPKSVTDLTIQTADVSAVRETLFWALELTETVTTATVSVQAIYNRDMRDLLNALKRGDPEALQAYQYAINNPEADR